MKVQILFAILSLILVRFCDMCKISGEMCECKKDTLTIEMSCLERYSSPNILNLNEIVIYDDVANLTVKIENKIYNGINKSSYGLILNTIKELWLNNNKINKLESDSFQALNNLTKI